MSIRRVLCSKADFKDNLLNVLKDHFLLEPNYAEVVYRESFDRYGHVEKLIDTVWILIESPYTDKVYRDSFYSYFSSKLGNYFKDCIRLSFFNSEIKAEDFVNEGKYQSLKERYLGFMILRPTDPKIIGRSAISPKALKQNHFLCVTSPIKATANSLKFSVDAFPHSSQDGETITCAETTLWAIMEYFGNKYPEYKPVLPSQIINSLKRVSAERQVPSKGLNIQQMAYALKEFGFGTKIYAKNEFGKDEFKRLFSTYVESGLPLIVAMENTSKGGNIAHALLCIGHEKSTSRSIDALPVTKEDNAGIASMLNDKAISFYDYADLNRDFVFVDDNLSVYQLNKLDTPATHYSDSKWHSCDISYFIVPLYTKIYLEAFEAKSFLKKILLTYFVIEKEEVLIRCYLTSSRSYKHALSFNSTFDSTIKEIILETTMPKFLWIGEISTKTLIKQQKANGLIILDATEANPQSLKSLIMAAYKGSYIRYDQTINWFSQNSLPLSDFNIFTNNLKGF